MEWHGAFIVRDKQPAIARGELKNLVVAQTFESRIVRAPEINR
jgi:hypothetical protein